MTRLQMLVDGGQDPLAVAQVRGAREQQTEIAGRIQPPSRLLGGIREGLDRIEALRESHCDPHGHA
jgi:hypothetical protein